MKVIPCIRLSHFVGSAIALTCLCAPGGLMAQVREGSRVRVTSPVLEKRVEGNVAALDATQLVINGAGKNGASITIPREEITQLEVSRGSKGHAGTGALIGGGIGLAGGVALGVAASHIMNTPTSGEEAAGGALVGFVGAVAGALIGAGIGAMIRTEQWDELDLAKVEPTVSLSPARQALGVRFGLRLSF